MQPKDVLYEVYWDDENGNTFYQGCKTKQEVTQLIEDNKLRNPGAKIICTIDDKVISIDEF